jgi:hypothetical protein
VPLPSNSSWRLAFFAALTIGVVIIALLAYGILDQAVTITHRSDGHSRTEKDLKTLASIFPRDRYSKKDILALLRKRDPKGFIVEKPCTVQLNGLRFEFDNKARLVNVNTQAETSPDYECPRT